MTADEEQPVDAADTMDEMESITRAISAASECLPPQGPITAFAFLNTLQAFENLPFDEGLCRGAELYGCEPYLSETGYQKLLASGRIKPDDLLAVLIDDIPDDADHLIGSLGTRLHLRLSMLQHPIWNPPNGEIRWLIAEADALRTYRSDVPATDVATRVRNTRRWVMSDLRVSAKSEGAVESGDSIVRALVQNLLHDFGRVSPERWDDKRWQAFSLKLLWRVCQHGASLAPPAPEIATEPLRHRDAIRTLLSIDTDEPVHDLLIRFCATFIDQGFATWRLPNRDEGFFGSFLNLYKACREFDGSSLAGLREELQEIQQLGLTPLECLQRSLGQLGVQPAEYGPFVAASMIALRGWAGMLRQLELRPDRAVIAVSEGTLTEFMAIRLVVESVAIRNVLAQHTELNATAKDVRALPVPRSKRPERMQGDRLAFQMFQLAQVRGWHASELCRLPESSWIRLAEEIRAFPGIERRRLYHAAFERSFRVDSLNALAARYRQPAQLVEQPSFQAAFCLDAREESYRRHLEEVDPTVETFGLAGFFGVPMYYRGAADAHFAALCPVVIIPKHWVVEEVVYSLADANRRRANARRAIGTTSHRFQHGSRGAATGALLTASVGALATIPLVARVLAPRTTARIRRAFGQFIQPPPVTRLRIERTEETAGPDGEGIGFSVEEMARMGETALRDIGLTSGFARLFVFFGHGASCLNNPHKSCYDCGACSGQLGAPNARVIALMLNDPRVRSILHSRGLEIPETTQFLGGFHNTSDDSVTFFDLDLMPRTHRADFEYVQDVMLRTGQRNAHERCRRFESAPLEITPAEAIVHVEERTEDLAQTRPEYGNSTNALCVVGRRSRIRGMYLDRRAFLMSYDPTQDDESGTILARILSAVIPVCAGINLQYTLSRMDNDGWGSGTKLPHNVASMLGVMNGAASDLRPGLPWQSVDIHEPMRLLFVIETVPEVMQGIMQNNSVVERILKNGWAQLALVSPDSGDMTVYQHGVFSPFRAEETNLPTVRASIDWYRGWRDNLSFALIAPPPP